MSSIETIAQKAGYHKSTVSRVLSGYKWINPDTKEKILKIAEELEYKPNFHAKALSCKKTHIIGMIAPMHHGISYFPELFEGVESAAKKKGYRLLIYNFTRKSEKLIETVKLFIDQQVDGIISFFPYPSRTEDVNYLEYIMQSGTEFVSCAPAPGSDQFVWDVERGISLAVDHLFENGHRQIAFIGDVNLTGYGKDKQKAYKNKLSEYNIKYNNKLCIKAPASVEGGYEAMMKLLKHKEKFTAVMTSRDITAIGAMKAIKNSGLRIPEDLAVVGFDNLTVIHPFAEVPLTSIEPAKFELGYKACELLIKKIEGKKRKTCKTICVPPRIVVRASSDYKI